MDINTESNCCNHISTHNEFNSMSLNEAERGMIALLNSGAEIDQLISPVGRIIEHVSTQQLFKEGHDSLKQWIAFFSEHALVEEQLLWNIKRAYERYEIWAETCTDPKPLGTGLLTLENLVAGFRFAKRNGNVMIAYVDSLANDNIPSKGDDSYAELAAKGRKLKLKAAKGPALKSETKVLFKRKPAIMVFPDAETLNKACYFLHKAGIELTCLDRAV